MITINNFDDYVAGSKDVSPFFVSTLIDAVSVPLFMATLQRRHNMRIDLVSLDLYQTVEHIDAIMEMNGLVNPFAVREGMVLVYTDLKSIPSLLNNQGKLDSMREELIDANKGHRTDPERVDYLRVRSQIENEKNALPPTVLKEGVKTVVVENGTIKLLPGF